MGAGLQLFKTFEGNNGERITPRARVVRQKEPGDSQARYSTGFAAAPDLVFGASSQAVGEQVLAWNLGMTRFQASERLSIMADHVGERRDGQIQNGVMLGLGYRFQVAPGTGDDGIAGAIPTRALLRYGRHGIPPRPIHADRRLQCPSLRPPFP